MTSDAVQCTHSTNVHESTTHKEVWSGTGKAEGPLGRIHYFESPHGVRSRLENLVNGTKITTHIHNLRSLVYDPDHSSSVTVALHYEQEFVIDSVLAHRGNRNRRSTLEFHIRWAGFGEAHDSWEDLFPWGTSKNGGSFQDFFRGFFPNAVLVFPRLF